MSYPPPESPAPGADPGQPYTGQPHTQQPHPAAPATNGKAIAALVTGLASLVLSMCCVGLVGPVAIVLGVKARGEVRRSNGTQSGDGIAVAGIVTGAVGLVVSVGLLVAVLVLVATGNADYDVGTYTGT